MRLIILSIIAAGVLLAMAFDAKKCDHVFVAVEQAEVREPACTIFADRKELICIKCFHRQKQLLDYGNVQPHKPITISEYLRSSSCVDACNLPRKTLFIKGDTLMWSK